MGSSRLAKSGGGSGPRSGGAMFAVSRRCHQDLVDLPFAQQVDRPLSAEPGIAGQHEVDAHPWIIDREGIQHFTDAPQQAVLSDLEGGVDVAVANVEPEDLVALS